MKNMKNVKQLFAAAAVAAVSPVGFQQAAAEPVDIAHFFGSCENAGADPAAAVGEACIILSIMNAYTALDNGVEMVPRGIEWGTLYDQVKAGYSSGTPPDVHVMHRSRMLEFVDVGLLADLTDDLAGAGIDVSDWADRALSGVTHDGKVYGVPMDFHANLWHMNVDLLEQAGLVENGKPIVPKSPEEMLEHARKVREATGKDYMAVQLGEGELGLYFLLSMLWQQGGQSVIVDGEANFDQPETRTAFQVLLDLIEGGHANKGYTYVDASQAFVNGESAVHINGTWVVDAYSDAAKSPDSALSNYQVTSMPNLFSKEGATWGDSHSWVIPASLKTENPDRYKAALSFMAFLNENNIAWAKTGHMAVRKSVLASSAYQLLPQRANYVTTADIVRDLPRTPVHGALRDVIRREIQSIYLADVPLDTAFANIDADLQDILDDL